MINHLAAEPRSIAIETLEQKRNKYFKNVCLEIVPIDKVIAEQFLKTNFDNNRKLSMPKVKLYAKEMLTGEWSADSNMICFNSEGRLINGQHRLHAIALSDTVHTFVVAKNMPTEAARAFDQGRARTQVDRINISGINMGQKHNTIIRNSMTKMGTLRLGSKFFREKSTDLQIQQLYQAHKNFVDYMAANKRWKLSIVNAVALKMYVELRNQERLNNAFYTDGQCAHDRATHFLQIVYDDKKRSFQEDNQTDSAARLLRIKIQDNPKSASVGNWNDFAEYSYTLKAGHAFAFRNHLRQLHRAAQDPFTYIFDLPATCG
jgi:hypothetical protein|tara:strand:+ start:154 stop:1107 length:954 start_codon:yes stop_codon:yes gene_type:complete